MEPAPPLASNVIKTGAVEIKFDALEALEVPCGFVAVIVNVYAVFDVRPVTEIVPDPAWARVPDPPGGLEVTEYEVIACPPLLTGAVNETVAVLCPVEVAIKFVGAPGTVRGVAVAVAVAPVPIALLGVTVNVYEVPFVSPVNVQEVFEVFVQEAGGVTAGLDVTE
jgi:hypothetical protein